MNAEHILLILDSASCSELKNILNMVKSAIARKGVACKKDSPDKECPIFNITEPKGSRH